MSSDVVCLTLEAPDASDPRSTAQSFALEIQTRAERHGCKAVAVFKESKWVVFVQGIANSAIEQLVDVDIFAETAA